MRGDERSHWPILIGGCHRSGTSLVRRILDSHSRVHCGPEVKFFPDLYSEAPDPLRHLRFMSSVRALASEDVLIETLGGALVQLHQHAAAAAGKARWADKAPENIRYTDQWQQLLGSRWLMVHVLRNPLDTVASLIEAQSPDLPSEPGRCAAQYCAYTADGARFATAHPARYRAVLYEQLVTEPCETLDGLMQWLGEELEPAQLAFNAQPHVVGLEDWKVSRTTKVHTSSLHTWRKRMTMQDAELVWDLTAEAWLGVDPDKRFVDPPDEPAGSSGWP